MARGKGKGSGFEREICKQLSLWWSDGEDDSLFWRTSNSGGRATVRGRKGKKTEGHYGDICATGEAGRALLRLVTFEIKRGYPDATIHGLLDAAPKNFKNQEYAKWIQQATESAKGAGTPYWAIIHRRDKREAIIAFSERFFDELCKLGDFSDPNVLSYLSVTLMRLESFLAWLYPEDIRTILEKHGGASS